MLPSLPLTRLTIHSATSGYDFSRHSMALPATQWQALWQQCGQQAQQAIHHTERQKRLTSALIGALALGLGALTHRLPVRNVSWHKALPTDWKTYTRIGLGLVGVQQVNQALQWHPPGWLAALQTMAVVVPLSVGLKKLHLPTLAISGLLVAGLVQGSQWLKSSIQQKLIDNDAPQWAPWVGIGIMLATLPLAWKVVPWITTGLLRKVGKMPAAAIGGVAAGNVCLRQCTPGGVICLSELTEALTGVAATAHPKSKKKGMTHNVNF